MPKKAMVRLREYSEDNAVREAAENVYAIENCNSRSSLLKND
jgi:hypothetical protein